MLPRSSGFAFYDYHRSFSARAATLLVNYNVRVDWSKRDSNIFMAVTAGYKANACNLCRSTSHSTDFCSQLSNVSRQYGSSTPTGANATTDKRGRQRVKFQGREMCNNYNTPDGCQRSNCSYLHACLRCHSSNHGKDKCNQRNEDAQHNAVQSKQL